METSGIVLEYLRVLLSASVVSGSVVTAFLLLYRKEIRSLLDRIASIKFGSAEVSMPQPSAEEKELPELSGDEQVELPEGVGAVGPQVEDALRNAILSERARAHLWEYRYLNYFYVTNTKKVLDWLVSIETSPTVEMYDAWWIPSIPTAAERRAIIIALEEHTIVLIENGVINVTPKGREYAEWKGPTFAQSLAEAVT